MSVTVDNVVSTMLKAGGEVVICDAGRIANNLGVPPHVSSPWFRAHRLLGLETYDLFINILHNWEVRIEEDANIGRLANIMEDMELLAVAEAVSRLGNPETRITLSIKHQLQASSVSLVTNCNTNSFSFGVKQPINTFVGRANVLKQLNDYFLDNAQKCILIYAIGGQGKTELCKKFVHDLITANSLPPVVVWLPGESIQEFTSKVSKFASRLSIPTDKAGKPLSLLRLLKKVAKQVKNQFQNQRWLVVVDNVVEGYPELEKIVQILTEFQAFVLITCRRNDILSGAPRTTSIRLETLSSLEARLLVRNSLNTAKITDVTLVEIYLPLFAIFRATPTDPHPQI